MAKRPPAAAWWAGLTAGAGEPAEAGLGLGGGAVLAADPARVAERVDFAEHVIPIDFAVPGLMPVGHVGNLDVGDHRHMGFQPLTQVALGDLAMVHVELQADAIWPDRRDDSRPMSLVSQEETGHVAVVDRLQDHLHP